MNSKHNILNESTIDLALAKVLVNTQGLDVNDKEDWKAPSIGDKVTIISWDTQTEAQECVKVCKLPYVIVKSISPEIVGIGRNKYAWAYTISIEESPYLKFMQWHYEILQAHS